ncbi:hypothetical protein [Mycolicibacter longobardus]|uniref:DUF732 domain-containing protein n=1 Tax=Mycolicibacter longobardus TaxID=1108812 RepID=A0A1X1YFH4_9MYCO|nr:hypothetical protein [Mycolicibacter longobardus]ORW09836.1 hypothetical protein AWC16_14980 [Mycolicibacter longobardus]
MKLALTMTTVLAATVLLSAPPAMADARQDFLDQYHATGALQLIPDENLLYIATRYCHDKADGNGELWRSRPSNMLYATAVIADVADQTLCT